MYSILLSNRFIFLIQLIAYCIDRFASIEETALVFNSREACAECRQFLKSRCEYEFTARIAELSVTSNAASIHGETDVSRPDRPSHYIVHCLLFPVELAPIAKEFWQHTGRGVSSRFAEHCLRILEAWLPIESIDKRNPIKAGRARFQINKAVQELLESNLKCSLLEKEASIHIDERFGRNLDVRLVDKALKILKNRLIGVLGDSEGLVDLPATSDLAESDVFLFPTGMSAIYQAHKMVLDTRPNMKSVQFGFPYIDTLKIQQKFGPGCHFYGMGDEGDLEALKAFLLQEDISCVICEFPSNPLLKSPPLADLWMLAAKHNFFLIVDETVGNPVNISCISSCDMIVSSLTKIFSGDSNVMAGSIILNPASSRYKLAKSWIAKHDQKDLWCEDVLVLERNSRTFEARIRQINASAEMLCDTIKNHPKGISSNNAVTKIYYPKYDSANYLRFSTGQGYGGLFSIVLESEADAANFYDRLEIYKGPSLGTNFSLACPYTILAHYNELAWAASYGLPRHLIRVSVGLEDCGSLVAHFLQVLDSLIKM